MDTVSTAESIDIAELENDPSPFYTRMRHEAPVTWVPVLDGWLVSRWDEAAEILGDPTRWGAAPNVPIFDRVAGGTSVLGTDGAKHADMRAGVDAAVAPQAVLGYVDAVVRPIAQKYLERFQHRGRADLTAEYFEPISVEALRHVMGLAPYVDAETLVRWFHDLAAGSANHVDDPEVWAATDRATAEIEQIVGPVLDRLRREGPSEGMLSHMVFAARDSGEARTNAEIYPNLKVVLLGGMQEPGHAGANTMFGLLSNPGQLAEVREDLDLIPAAVQEGLRWISALGTAERRAIGDQTVGGVTVPDGALVYVPLHSVNRDETRFEQPNAFDINRKRKPHLAFGGGEHFCAGHFFARHVMKIMLEELIPALPGARLDPESNPVVTGFMFRAAVKLPAAWDVRSDQN
ncbi:cytochrome P450 [Rhodococcus sp. NBC_00297]|uniref:cytochrome P450 n=1 Tax=Rhodococcus sp. NBC_00297 TaxID=2976005 RepID=UPI002E2C2317|nr:cytochrome P450 [Rhodococcus sp. NBC_00297]